MAQYLVLEEGEGKIYANVNARFRAIVRTGRLYIDKALTVTGFDGVESTDWESVTAYKSPIGNGVFRYGVRNGGWVMDETLDVVGFSGVENANWEQIISFKKP